MARTSTCCLNCLTTVCVKHLLKICHRCAPIVLKDAAPDAVFQERPVPRPPPPQQLLEEEPRNHLLNDEPDTPLPAINVVIAELFQEQWPLELGQMEQIEEHLEKRRIQDKQKKLPVAHHEKEPDCLLHENDSYSHQQMKEPDRQLPEINRVIHHLYKDQWPLKVGQMEKIEELLEKQHKEGEYKKQTVAQEKEPDHQLREKESDCQLPAVIHSNFQDQLPIEDVEDIEKEMEQWCTQDEPIEKEKDQWCTQDEHPVERAQLRHSGGPISTHARTPSTLMIWKAQWENERLSWEREEKRRKREAEQRVLEERAAAVDKRTIELAEEYNKLQVKRREEERAELLLKEKTLADALKQLVSRGDEK
jgi:hypothetical protein